MSMMRFLVTTGGVPLLVAGCAAIPAKQRLPDDHPASPNASESPIPAQSRTLTVNPSSTPVMDDKGTAEIVGDSMPHEMNGAAGVHHGMGGMAQMKHGTADTRPGENAAPSTLRSTPTTVPAAAAEHHHAARGGQQ